MKKMIFSLMTLFFITIYSNAIFSQYVGFSPDNGQILTGTSASNSVHFQFYYTWSLSPRCFGAYVELKIGSNSYLNNVYATDIGVNIPTSFDLSAGTNTWTINLYEYFGGDNFVNTATQTNTFSVKYTLYAANNFGAGSINLDNSTVTSGSSVLKFIGDVTSVGAIDQSDNAGYNRTWNTNGTNNSVWKIHNSFINGATPRNFSYSVTSNDNGATLIADLKKICNVTFQNTGNQITINGSNYSSSGTIQSVEGNPITVSTVNSYSVPGVDFVFSGWNKAGSYYYSPITVSDHSSFTARYIGTPNINNQGINFSTTLGQPIVVYWTDNPNTNVSQYQIYRKIGPSGTPSLIGTVGRGVQQFTDQDYLRSQFKVGTLLYYEVKEYYSIDHTYSSDYWAMVYGIDNQNKLKDNKGTMTLAGEIPTEYKLDNYPNPFNPTTVINYQLPNDGFVTVKVYDMLGREIATLVNGNKNAGYYKVNFDASRLTSGVYIYSIKANNFVLSKKMLLMK
jgi:hypothetical protein